MLWNNRWKVLSAALGIGLGLAAREALLRRREADLRGQVVLITGSSRGLGFLLAKEFAREGCRLAICARDGEELERAKADLERRGAVRFADSPEESVPTRDPDAVGRALQTAQGGEALAVECDVSDRQQVERLVQEVTRRLGRVDVLVNNAGIIQVGPVQTMTIQDFEDAVGAMLWGVLHPTLAVLPQMLERKSGRIVNITSVGGKVSVPHLLPYNCAKFAAMGLSEGLRAELANHNITVTTIVPGLMRTGSFLNALFKGDQKAEFTWFSLGSSLPFISMDAERAARQIVSATKRGESEIILSIPANVLARFHGLFPGVVADLLAIADRILLPKADGAGTAAARGVEVHEQLRSPLFNVLIRFGLSAARRFHEYPGPLNVLARVRKGKKAA